MQIHTESLFVGANVHLRIHIISLTGFVTVANRGSRQAAMVWAAARLKRLGSRHSSESRRTRDRHSSGFVLLRFYRRTSSSFIVGSQPRRSFDNAAYIQSPR